MLRIFFVSKPLTSFFNFDISLCSVKIRIKMVKTPAKSGVERRRIFRAKLKADEVRYKAYKEKDKERKRAERKD